MCEVMILCCFVLYYGEIFKWSVRNNNSLLLGEGARRREGVSDFRFVQNKALFPHTTQEGLDLHTHSKCEEISNNQSAKDICARTRVLEESCLPTKLLGTFNL